MNPIRYTLKELKEKTVPIGREGENEYTVVTIDCAEVYEEHPNAVASMKAQNPNKVIYPVVIERSGNDIIWTVKASDLTVKGDGRFQLTFTEGTVIHKTVIGRTLILKSLAEEGPVPEPVAGWIDEATELMEDMEEKRDNGYFKGDPGDPGAPGHSPVLTADKVGKTTTIYSDGTQLAQILDGQDGQAGAIIDDTTPAADKVFSSSKVNGELTQLKSALQGYKNIVTPEQFGAKGDGVTDDTDALNSCIAYVLDNPSQPKAAIRGYGKYNTTTGIVVHGSHIDLFINEINHLGSGPAVTLIGSYSKFVFNRITTEYGGSNKVGILCTTTATPERQYDGFYCNYVECNYILSKGNTVEIKYPSTASTEGIYYSVLKFRNQYSYNGNIISVEGTSIGEIDIYGKSVTAPNGYLFYAPQMMWNSTHQPIRLHQYGFEGNLKNGVRGNVALIECRTRELMDKRQENTDEGFLFDFTGVVPCSYKDEVAGDVDITAIKASDAKTFADVVDSAIARAESGASEYSVWYMFGIEGKSYAVLKNCVRAAGGLLRTQAALPPGDIYVYYQHIAYKPHDDWYRIINADITTGQTQSLDFITPTIFDINASSVDIHLDYSYCCIAINEFRVIQHKNKTAVVYDKLGNKIFDGTNKGAGVFVFKCSRVPLDGFTIEYGDNQTMTAPADYVRRVYTGENETWTVTTDAEPPFRTIADITTTEDLTSIAITTDTNGDSFSLQEINAQITVPASNGASNGGLQINDDVSDRYLVLPNIFKTSGSQTRFANIQIRGGRMFGHSTSESTTNGYTTANLQANRGALGYYECADIKKIIFSSLNQHTIPTGTKIKIYGR